MNLNTSTTSIVFEKCTTCEKKIKEIDKIREPFLKKLKKCKTQKCSTQNKKKLVERKRYLKEEKKQCSKEYKTLQKL